MFDNCSNDLKTEEKLKVASLLNKFEDVFSKHEFDIGLTNLIEHSIDTGDAKPIKLPPRRVPIAFADHEKKVLKELEENKIIRKSNSPWSAAIVIVVRKDQKLRTCIDYRGLNRLTTIDAYPIPRTSDCLDAVSGSIYFSTCDLTAGYYQIPVKDSDTPKTAFATKYGLFEFTRLPFGTVNGSATCQRLMEIVLNGLQWQTCLIYLDDVIIFGRTFAEHISRLSEVLQRIKESGLKLKPTKCQFLQREVTFLGHIVSKDGVRPNPDNVEKLKLMPTPQNVTEVRQVLGLASYYRRFVQNFSKIAKPLIELTKKMYHLTGQKVVKMLFKT